MDSHFEACADVPKGGVLLALPALLASGLWERTEEHFELPQGYYQMVHVFLLVALLALARVRSLEGLRYCAPGEWGKVLGLDRVPEVRTLRNKLQQLGQPEKVAGQGGFICIWVGGRIGRVFGRLQHLRFVGVPDELGEALSRRLTRSSLRVLPSFC